LGTTWGFLSVSPYVMDLPPFPQHFFGSIDEFPLCLGSILLSSITSSLLEIHSLGHTAAVVWTRAGGGASLVGRCWVAWKCRCRAPQTQPASPSQLGVMVFLARPGRPLETWPSSLT